MIKISTNYLIFLVVSTVIAASTTLTGTYFITDIDKNDNNNDGNGLFAMAHAQSPSSATTGTVKIYLLNGPDGDPDKPIIVNVYVAGKNANPYSFQLSPNGPNIGNSKVVTLDPGFYSVTSDSPTHFIYTGGCKTTIKAGQNLECAILYPLTSGP